MKVYVLCEFEFHELTDIKLFSSEFKANKYKEERLNEKDRFGFDIVIEEQEVE